MHAQTKTKFKKTPIGEIPEDWEVVELKKITDINKESVDPRKAFPDKEFVYIDIESVENGTGKIRNPKRILGKEAPSRARRVVHANDVIMSTVRPYLKAFALIPKKYDGQVCSTGFAVLTPKRELVDAYYLLYALFSDTTIKQCKSMMVGGQYPALTTAQVAKIRIPLPPLPEQRKIAEILRTVDEAIEKTDEAIERTERLKKGLMQRLLTRGIKHERFKKTELGEIPEEWEVVRLGDVASSFQYGLSTKLKDSGRYPVIKMDSILNGKVLPINLKYTDLDEITFRKYKLEKGDVLINRTNSYELVGRTGVFMLEGDYVFASYLIRLKPNLNVVDPMFLTLYLIFAGDRLRQLATRAVSQANINASNLKKFKIPLPPLEEQKQIAETLSTVDRKLELLRKRREKLELVKRGMMKDLLTGRRVQH